MRELPARGVHAPDEWGSLEFAYLQYVALPLPRRELGVTPLLLAFSPLELYVT